MIGKRYAIIVGSNNYAPKNKLDYTLKDAQDMKDILMKRCKFEEVNIELLLFKPHDKASGIAKIDAAFERIKKVFKKGQDSFLFYFSGHGNKLPTPSIILCDKQIIGIEDDIEKESYPLQTIYDKIVKLLNPKYIYLLIDACYSGGNYFIPKSFKNDNFIHYHGKGVCGIYATTSTTEAYEATPMLTKKYEIKNGILTHFLKATLNDKLSYKKNKMNIGIVSGQTIAAIEEFQSALPHEFVRNYKQIPQIDLNLSGDDSFAFWDEKDEIEEHKDIIVTKPLQIIEEEENEIITKDYEEGVKYNSKNQPIITIASSYFFHNRIRKGFEEKTGLKIISDLQEAVARLEICLKDPIVFHNDYDNEKEKKLYDIYDNPYKKVVTQPIWLFRNGATSIKKFEVLSPTKFLLYSNFSKYGTNSCHEIELSKLATFISWNKHQCFIYIEVKAEQPYQEGYAYKGVNGVKETQTLYDGEPLLTKEEDNFRIYRNGKLIELSSANKEERTHYIQKYNFIIGEQFGAWDKDNYSNDLDKILREEMTLEEFVEKVKNKKPSDVDW